MPPRRQSPRDGPATDREARRAARGLSETTGLAVLVGFTLLVTASLGVGVIFFEQEPEGPQAEFSYSYFGESSRLLITLEEGENLAAGDLVISGPAGNVTWAELAGYAADRTLESGAAVQVGQSNAYGSGVQQTDRIRIVHARDPTNATVVGEWTDG